MIMLATEKNPLMVSMGPHYPSMHGVLRLIAR
uniref:NADH-plastoquinone oxidoreductase subunit 7 n=4 Tax=Keteleeria TaxID=3323 RepID=A0A8F2XRT9_9CONI|nr:NADH-plastoquinone oxidoreductase subunit 7 [Keteleeria evelyniana]QHO05359.1 NADH-plastoquinone oxidoreductase subunit 7 [Keteleeria hainanensis]QWW91987.1 NADH-plastoquinone oxidoreductase subunit 7 [Keteleeria fortunei var. cyclolepis]QXI88832.1 NADH-plastoquinone oxidoreductase subunit 7 [Keteleeria davidiana]UWI54163.1 NADH-plastoquinone oxidoreductase subunit 7 [Keteleeria evelyniana var. pendula]QOW07151.1 NADH-plastoquinone oxidoreductase subunit 7 [Keteleeria evelyniana]